MLRVSRLLQPRNPQFWLLVALNLLSSAIAFVLRSYELAPLAMFVLAVFAFGNVLFGMLIAVRLMAD
jgi:hypothetical protein